LNQTGGKGNFRWEIENVVCTRIRPRHTKKSGKEHEFIGGLKTKPASVKGKREAIKAGMMNVARKRKTKGDRKTLEKLFGGGGGRRVGFSGPAIEGKKKGKMGP